MSTVNENLRQRTEAEKRKQKELFELAERFHQTTDPKEAKRLGDYLGRMVFSATHAKSRRSGN